MARGSAGKISITLSAGTAQFVADMDQAKVRVRDFGNAAGGATNALHGTVSGTQAASGALRLLEGNFTNNIRAVERFAASTLGLGDVLTKIFPLVGAAASVGILAKLGEEAYNFFRTIQDAPEKITGAFRELDNSLRTTNDDLVVANDRLENVIAKLEGKRQNTLKLALDEARASADHLTDSLDKSLGSLTKLLKEENVSVFRQVLGEAGTKDIEKELGGRTGTGGFRAQVAAISDKGLTGQELADALAKAYSDELANVDKKLADTEALQRRKNTPIIPNLSPSAALSGSSEYANQPADQTARLELLRGVRRTLQLESARIPLTETNRELTVKKDSLEAARDNAKLDRPFDDRIKKIQAQIEGVRAGFAAVGQDEDAQVLAKAFGAASLAIEEVNKALERTHQQLTASQKDQILAGEETLARTRADFEFAKSIQTASDATKARISSEEILTAAIGKGYEATKAANVESRIAIEFAGKSKNFLAENQEQVNRRRADLGQEHDTANKQRIDNTVDGLNTQIELEKNLAAVQKDGAATVRLVELATRLRDIATKGGLAATKEQINAEIELFNATKANLSAENVAALNAKVAATERLTAASIEGAEALRRQAIEEKVIELRRQGASPAEISATRGAEEAEHQREITSEAVKRVNVYKDQLGQIDQQIGKLHEIQDAGKGTLDTSRALRDLEDERLHTLAQQALSLGSAKDGLRAFFLEAQTQAEKTSVIVYKSLNSAVDRVSENLAKGITGQKTNFAQAFKDIAQEALQATIKQQIQGVIGKVGQALGINGLAGKPDGSSADRALWVQLANAGLYGSGPLGTSPTSSGGIGGLAGKIGGGLGGFIIKNLVGQDTNLPVSRGGSGTVVYNIDARGSTDPLLTVERVTQGLKATHDSSIADAVLAFADRRFRVPSGAL